MSSEENTKKTKQEIKKKLLKERQEEASIVRKIVLVCLFLLLIAFGVAGTSAYYYVKGALEPVDETSEDLISIDIPIGSTPTRIGNILEENGLIYNASFFRYYVRYKNESGFQAGNYQLSKSMTMDEMIAALKEGTILQEYALSFTVPEGRWLENVLKVISENTDHTIEELEEKVLDREYLENLIARYPILSEDILDSRIRWPLEGYLFPSRYDFLEENPSIETIIEAMIERTEQVLRKYSAEFEENAYNIHEILALASIIEGEAQKTEDRYTISGVLYNRLKINMALQVDPTVAYAHGTHLSRTMIKDTTIDSPYNTYRYPGIPVGPINNPGEASIKAAVQPEEHKYLYFYADSTGKVHYTETFQQHQEIIRQYRDN
jgi:UPF0755 protein